MNTGAKAVMIDETAAARSLYAAGRYEEALAALAGPGGDLAGYYTLRGDIQFHLKRFEEASGSYFTAVTLEAVPENEYAQYRLAVCLHQLGRWTSAAEAFLKVLEIDPYRDDVRLGLGACLLHMKRPEEALAHFERCGAERVSQRAVFGKAVALQLLRRHEEAEGHYRRILASDPRHEASLANLIALYAETGDFEKLRRYATRLLEVAPDSVTALQGLAAASLGNHEYEAASRYCSRIVERAPNCVEAWHNLRFTSDRVMSTLRSSVRALDAGARRE